MENYKQRDREAILSYLKGKDAVTVADIKEYSGAEWLRVYPILTELELEGKLKVLEQSELGSPISVTLI
jgi:hypothetical protein